LRRVRSRALREASRRARRINRLVDDAAAYGRVLVEEFAQLLVDELRHVAADVAVQLALGLPFELRLRHFHTHHRGQPLANVVASQCLLVLEQLLLLAKRVDGAGERGIEAAQVRASIHRVDGVGEAEDVFRIAVVVLQRHFHRQRSTVGQIALGLEVHRFVVQHLLALIEQLDEFGDAPVY